MRFDRNWIEIRIMSHLNDKGHALQLSELRELIKDLGDTIVCTVFDLRDDGLLVVRDLEWGGKIVDLTPEGKQVLLAILSGKAGCC